MPILPRMPTPFSITQKVEHCRHLSYGHDGCNPSDRGQFWLESIRVEVVKITAAGSSARSAVRNLAYQLYSPYVEYASEPYLG